MARKRVSLNVKSPDEKRGDQYGLMVPPTSCFSSGCTLLDCVLGGGWAYSRMANIIGDHSTGKTLLAIEACANFAKENPKGKIYYVETEAAFDKTYAETLGLPLSRVDFPADPERKNPIETVEDFFDHLEKRVKEKRKERVLYILDSLDAITDRAEKERDINAGSYSASKQKKLSELFRRINKPLMNSDATLIILSQIRDKLNVSFGKKHMRAGGRAMDFYATHALWLAQVGRIKPKTKKGVKRTIGVHVRAKCEKNKIASPYRECDFPIIFQFGIEDVWAGLDWLISVGETGILGLSEDQAQKLKGNLDRLSDEEYEQERANVSKAVREVWSEIESRFTPKRRKY